jgi:hypothetical protein
VAGGLLVGECYGVAESSGFFVEAFATGGVEEEFGLRCALGDAVPALRLCVKLGGGGVRLAQGALVTPSTIPIDGVDAWFAQGAAVLVPEFNGPGAAGGGIIVPVCEGFRAPIGWLISWGFLSG